MPLSSDACFLALLLRHIPSYLLSSIAHLTGEALNNPEGVLCSSIIPLVSNISQ